MAKVIVLYESKYGNTRLVAETIIEGIRRVPDMATELAEVGKVDLNHVAGFDAILIGSPNHMGGPTGKIREFIDSLGKSQLEGKVAVFDTYLSKDFEKAVKKMEKRIGEKAPGLKLLAPGLSVRVEGIKGPVTEGELPKCQEFGAKIASLMA